MKNNFDFLRLLFALFVVIAHSYPLSGSSLNENWLTKVTSGQMMLSSIGVNGFFIISGYLIFQSLERSTTLANYFWKRILRLYPALFVVLVLTIVLAPFVYENEIAFLKNYNVQIYLHRNLSLYNLKYNINGIFTNNPYPNAINGSLWTICYEFSCYILFGVLFFVKKRNLRLLLIIFTLMLFVFIDINFSEVKLFSFYELTSTYFFKLGSFFLGGALLAILKLEKLNKVMWLIISAFLLIILSVCFNVYSYSQYLLLPVLVILIGLFPIKPFNQIHKIGDLSYGIYIYSFPVQQTLMYFFKFDTYNLMFWSVLFSGVFGYLSWHLVEKKALAYKNIFEDSSIKFNS